MKILYVCLFPIEANNSAMMRNLALVEGLIANGHEVDFLTIPVNRYNVILEDNDLNKINIIRVKGNRIYDAITSSHAREVSRIRELLIMCLRKVYHAFSVFDYTYNIAKNISIEILEEKKYDIVISSSDPKTSHIAVNNLIKQGLQYGKWIQYWGDPLTLDITNKNIYPKFYLKAIEKSILKNADSIVYVSPFTLREQKAMIPKISSKMHFQPIPYKKEKLYPNTNNTRFIVGYYGAYKSVTRDIMPLYKACTKLKEYVDLVIMGESDLKIAETENIIVNSRGDITEYEAKTDVLVCILNKKGTQIPGKIYHYAATNKPILVLIDGDNKKEMRDYLSSFNRYIICDNNEEDIINTIRKLMKSSKKYTPVKAFSPKTIAKNILNTLTIDSE